VNSSRAHAKSTAYTYAINVSYDVSNHDARGANTTL